MAKTVWGVIVVLVVLSLVATGCAAVPAEVPAPGGAQQDVTDLGGRKLIWAVDNAYPPFSFLDEEGNGIGFDYDLAEEVCKHANCTLEFKEFAWDGIFEAAQAGEFDINMGGCTVSVDRAKVVDFSDPFYEYGQVILVRADDTAITDEAALAAGSQKIGTQAGTTNEITAIEKFGEDRVTLFDTFEMPVVALLSGDVDAVVIDEVAAIGFMSEDPGKLKIAFSITGGEVLALFMPPGSEIQPAVDQALNEMWDDGTMQALIDKWFSRSQ
ncbi:MAG: amino acid ABC transporter substrate-binding protein [Chloroflexi bacterium]|nr:amino acid ABC transporter substrate-binding protein [Chloroflexota bacterium]